jgi:lipopolysaccharide export system protein LptA
MSHQFMDNVMTAFLIRSITVAARIVLYLVGFAATSQLALALPEDRKQMAHLSADKADLNQSSHRGEYIGNVEFDQGTTHLRALKAITEGDKQNKLTFAVAFGNKESPAHYWEKTAEDKPELHAYADIIRYYPDRHLIELLGNARVTQGEDSFTATKISYDTEKQHVIASGDTNSRTVIIIHPEKKS